MDFPSTPRLSLRARIARSVPIEKASMMVALPRFARPQDASSAALGRALRSLALGRVPADEREWLNRIEAHRAELVADEEAVPPRFEKGATEGAAAWFATIEEPVAISTVAGLFSLPSRWGAFLMRVVRELAPRSCLELGSGLGLSAAYQTAALELNGAGSLTTLEGSRAWGAVAQKGLAILDLDDRASVRVGVIEETAPEVAQLVAPIDFAFIDADHSEQAVRADFASILPHLSPGAVVVLDDISLSDGMRRAWRAIKRDQSVSWAMSLGRVGVVAVGHT